MRARRALLPGLAVACLAAGYADLATGGVTLGPTLLVLGYCAAIPAAVLFGGQTERG